MWRRLNNGAVIDVDVQPDVWIAEMLRLPFFWRDSGPIYAWPPPPPPAYESRFVPAGPGPDWQAEIAARNVARHEESLRVIAHYQERDRVRQEREAVEARAANERERERLRRDGWPI
jgi:hypothetical protein